MEWRAECAKEQAHQFIETTAIKNMSKAVACLRVLGADVWVEGMGYGEWPLISTLEYPAGVAYPRLDKEESGGAATSSTVKLPFKPSKATS